MDNTKPFVSLACICEKVLQEKDSVLSLIRVIDVFFLAEQEQELPPGLFAPGVEFTIVVSLKAGQLRGTFNVGVKVRLPSDEVRTLMEDQPILLKGDEHGANVVARVILEAKKLGLYWFDVIWEGEVLTSIPLRLKRKEENAASEQTSLS